MEEGMDRIGIKESVKMLAGRKIESMYLNDFFLTWDKSDEEIQAVLQTAEILRSMRKANISPKIFDSGLGVSIFRDKSTRTRYSFAGACNFLGLGMVDMDHEKTQIVHNGTLHESANMISFLTEVIGVRDDLFLGEGNRAQKALAESVYQGYVEWVLPQRPTIINLQCDIDHPTQTLSDVMHLSLYYDGLENLKGKKIAVTWAYSPSCINPLSVPQGLIGLMTRFGMDVVLAHPQGYTLLPEVEELAKINAMKSGGAFERVGTMAEAFDGADIVYPKNWAPFSVMEERTQLLTAGNTQGLADLENRCLEQSREFMDWACTDSMMGCTKGGGAVYMHCLPADISAVNCEHGEVSAMVYDRNRLPLYLQAGLKPYVIAAMIFLGKVKSPAEKLMEILERSPKRSV